MNGKKARAQRRRQTHEFLVGKLKLREQRAAETLEKQAELAKEHAEIKAEGKLDPARHLLSRLNYKKVSR